LSLLTALNDAQRLLSLSVTSQIVADGQETQNLLYALAKEEVEECANDRDWPILRRTQSFTTTLASLQTSGKASDYDRAIADTFWNTTRDYKVYGPLSDQEWAIANGAAVTSATWQNAMFRYDGLHIFPVPTVAETVTYEYIINTPWETSVGAALTSPTADNDVSKFGDRLLKLGVVWRYKQAKGRDYAEDLRNYEMAKNAAWEKQRGAPRMLSIAPDEIEWPPDGITPDTGYG